MSQRRRGRRPRGGKRGERSPALPRPLPSLPALPSSSPSRPAAEASTSPRDEMDNDGWIITPKEFLPPTASSAGSSPPARGRPQRGAPSDARPRRGSGASARKNRLSGGVSTSGKRMSEDIAKPLARKKSRLGLIVDRLQQCQEVLLRSSSDSGGGRKKLKRSSVRLEALKEIRVQLKYDASFGERILGDLFSILAQLQSSRSPSSKTSSTTEQELFELQLLRVIEGIVSKNVVVCQRTYALHFWNAVRVALSSGRIRGWGENPAESPLGPPRIRLLKALVMVFLPRHLKGEQRSLGRKVRKKKEKKKKKSKLKLRKEKEPEEEEEGEVIMIGEEDKEKGKKGKTTVPSVDGSDQMDMRREIEAVMGVGAGAGAILVEVSSESEEEEEEEESDGEIVIIRQDLSMPVVISGIEDELFEEKVPEIKHPEDQLCYEVATIVFPTLLDLCFQNCAFGREFGMILVAHFRTHFETIPPEEIQREKAASALEESSGSLRRRLPKESRLALPLVDRRVLKLIHIFRDCIPAKTLKVFRLFFKKNKDAFAAFVDGRILSNRQPNSLRGDLQFLLAVARRDRSMLEGRLEEIVGVFLVQADRTEEVETYALRVFHLAEIVSEVARSNSLLAFRHCDKIYEAYMFCVEELCVDSLDLCSAVCALFGVVGFALESAKLVHSLVKYLVRIVQAFVNRDCQIVALAAVDNILMNSQASSLSVYVLTQLSDVLASLKADANPRARRIVRSLLSERTGSEDSIGSSSSAVQLLELEEVVNKSQIQIAEQNLVIARLKQQVAELAKKVAVLTGRGRQ